MNILLVLCACPDEPSADGIATMLVEERLAACVNRLPVAASTYRWQGKVCRESEHLLLIKTTRDRFDALCERIVERHPHELPEILAVAVDRGLEGYLSWVSAETRA